MGLAGAAVGGEVVEDVEGVLRLHGEGGGDGFGGETGVVGGEGGADGGEVVEEDGGGFFAGFDAGLVVGVDVDEGGVEANGAFEEADEHAEREGVEFGDAEGEGLAAISGEGLAGASEEALEEVATGEAGFDFERRGVLGFADLDEGGEEVVHAVAELLDIGVLVGGAFVAVNGDALIDDVAVEVELFAEGLHDELLEVFAEEDEAVLVGEDDHVFGAFALADVIPHEGEDHGGVLGGGERAGFFIHGGGASEELGDIDALEGGGEGADGAHDGGAAADPVPHGEAGEPVLGDGVFVELAAEAGDGDGVSGEVESGGAVGGFGFEHAVAGFFGAAGFGDDDGEGGSEFIADLGENAADAVGVGVIEEGDIEGRIGGGDGFGDELGAESGAADADDEDAGELATGGGGDIAGVDVGGELKGGGEGGGDLGLEVGGGEGGVAQPVVADHAVFVGVGDFTGFDSTHGGLGGADFGGHLVEVTGRDVDAAEVDGKAEIGVADEGLIELVPG